MNSKSGHGDLAFFSKRYFYSHAILVKYAIAVEHNPVTAIFLRCDAQGGKLKCWQNVVRLFSRL